jgi:hypothetical protein
MNNDPLNEPVSVWVNFSIRDWYTLKPMQRNPTSYLVNVSFTPVEVIHKFTPPFAGNLLVQCSVEYINDPDNSNNYLGWYNIPVLIWSADFEDINELSPEVSGFGWQTLVNGTLIKHNLTDCKT